MLIAPPRKPSKSASVAMFLTSVLLVVSLMAAFAALIDWYWSLPIAYVSVKTQKCVRVQTIPLQKKRTCAQLIDTNYTTVWVP